VLLICDCGREIESSAATYRYQRMNEKGKIIEQICSHGIKVIDKVAADADRIRRKFNAEISKNNIGGIE